MAEILNLSNSGLTTLTVAMTSDLCSETVVRLRRLDLRGNRFRDAPPALAKWPQIQKLDLRWNKVPSASKAVAELRGNGCPVLL